MSIEFLKLVLLLWLLQMFVFVGFFFASLGVLGILSYFGVCIGVPSFIISRRKTEILDDKSFRNQSEALEYFVKVVKRKDEKEILD